MSGLEPGGRTPTYKFCQRALKDIYIQFWTKASARVGNLSKYFLSTFTILRIVVCLITIHQLWNLPSHRDFLQLHSRTQEEKYSSGHQARWHSKWCSWQEQGRELAVLFNSVYFLAYPSYWNLQGYHCRTSQRVNQSWWQEHDRPGTQLGI